jgi:hypothetical protein
VVIKNGKAHPLEESFVPPEGGFDWCVPDGYFDDEFEAYSNRGHAAMSWQRIATWHVLLETPEWNDTHVLYVNNDMA